MPGPEGAERRAPGPAAPPTATGTWDALLEPALGGHGVATVFQPVVDLTHGTVAGYQALTRFTALPGVSTDQWFAAAARRGVAARLDAAALRCALAHRPTLPAGRFLALNVEPTSLLDLAVQDALLSSGSLAGVVLELTGHRPSESHDEVLAGLAPLRRAGARVAVDDAGAGHDGLQRILALRPDLVKVDRALVADVDRDAARAELLDMLCRFAARIDAGVLAEGVERTEEVACLRRLRVALAQGHHFGRPAPPWPELDPFAAMALPGRHDPDAPPTLRPLLDVVPWMRADAHGTEQGWAATAPDAPDVVVLDGHGRPIGLVTRTGDGVRARALAGPTPDVTTHPLDLAHRLATTPGTEVPDVVPVVDRAGAYVGIVRLRSLLAELARPGAAPDPGPGRSEG